MMEFESIEKLHMHFSRQLAGWYITSEEYDSINEMLKAVEEDVSKRIGEAEAFAKRVQEAVKNHEDVTLFGIDYTPLPVDADGVPIHVGDVIEWDDGIDAEVVAIGGSTLYYIDEVGAVDWTQAATKRHHRELTIENVLREFAEKITDSQIPNVHPTYEEAIAEYAAKLQLTDDYNERMRSK